MVKMLRQVGNSQALFIPKAILDLLQIDLNTPLKIQTDGVGLIVTPQRTGRAAEVAAIAADVMERRADGLRRLADQ